MPRSFLLLALFTMAPLCVPPPLVDSTPLVSGSPPMETTNHPGSVPRPAGLGAKLEQALAAKGSDYVPRTRHKDAQGKPQFTNRLILSTSPYLLQHAHNPVDWRPWGPEALAEAQALGRPIFISVGYSTCHWCHVMEEESFEDPQTAHLMNSLYVPIKVDREERPDVDSLYMTAVHLMRRQGGWPMSVWADAEGRPFYTGTYFPPDGKRGVRQGFQSILKELSARYHQDKERIHEQAAEVTKRMQQALAPSPAGGLLGREVIDGTLAWMKERFDAQWGGLGHAPKFPSTTPHRLLLRMDRRDPNKTYFNMVTRTLDKMAAGGMNDQLGGGFHRYSVDREWLVPHFEKMLYDNALLILDYLAAYQVAKDEAYAGIARETLDYLLREMRDPSGGFWSATDADSEGEEGTFFVWKEGEIDRLLGPEDAPLVKALWGVTAAGNFEHGTNILFVPEPLAQLAPRLKVSVERLRQARERAKTKLYEVRAQRIPPGLDDKLMADWNGLALSALATGAFVLDEPRYLEAAKALASFLLTDLRSKEGRLHHSRKDGRIQIQSFLEDYTFVITGLLDLMRVDADPRWLQAAIDLQHHQDALFHDDDNGGYFLTAHDQEVHIAREKPDHDGAIPCGNSYALHNLLRLAELTGKDDYAQRAEKAFKGMARALARGAMSHGLSAVERRLDVPREIVVVQPSSGERNEELMTALRRSFQPNAEVLAVTEGPQLQALKALVPWLEGKTAQGGKTTVYVCERGVCHRPATDLKTLTAQLAQVEPLP